jgi:hypothetical protein
LPQSITIKFKYSQFEYVEAIQRFYRNTSKMILEVVVSLILFVIGLGVTLYMRVSLYSVFLMVVSIFYLFVTFIFYQIIPEKRSRLESKFRDEYYLSFSQDGVKYKNSQIDNIYPWTHYQKVWEAPKYYYLIYSKEGVTIIPKRAFATLEDEQSFRQLLAEKMKSSIRKI